MHRNSEKSITRRNKIIALDMKYKLVLGMAATMICSCSQKKEEAQVRPIRVTTEVVVEESQAYGERTYVGTVEPEATTLVSFTGTGAVTNIYVSEGQHVGSGQLVATLDDTQARNMLHQAEFTAQQSEKQQEQSRIMVQQTEGAQRQSKLSQEQSANSVEMARATLDEALDAEARMRQLHEKGSLPEQKWVEVQSKVAQARAAYNTALKTCEQTAETYTQSGLNIAQSRVGVEQSQLGTAQSKVNVDIARKQLADCRIYAPYSGIVGSVMMNQGETALPSQPVASILKINQVKVKLSIPEKEISAITEHTPSQIQVEAVGDEIFHGKHIERSVVADAITHTYNIYIYVDNPQEKLLPGMICNVALGDMAQTDRMIAIPVNALQKGTGSQYFVWVNQQGKAVRRNVEKGAMRGNRVIITSGLNAGDQIITEGYQKVSEGTAIK